MFTKRLNGIEQLERKDLFAGMVDDAGPIPESVSTDGATVDQSGTHVEFTVQPGGISVVGSHPAGDANLDGGLRPAGFGAAAAAQQVRQGRAR